MKKANKIPTDSEQTLNLSDITLGSFIYCLAKAVINEKGFYDCMYQNKKTLILG